MYILSPAKYLFFWRMWQTSRLAKHSGFHLLKVLLVSHPLCISNSIIGIQINCLFIFLLRIQDYSNTITMKHIGLNSLLVSTAVLSVAFIPSTSRITALELLVGNTRGDVPVSLYTDGVFTPYLPDDVELVAPDHLVMKDGYLYISHGDSTNTSGIFRMNMDDGSYDEYFIESDGDGLLRPYGFAIDEGIIYVASFLSDQVLMYSEDTGEFVGEFAMGDGTEEGLCNGPNQMAIYNGTMYLTTQGTVAVDGVPQYGLASQIVMYDLETMEGSVYLPPPDVLEGSLGFISMLGIMIGCDDMSAVEDDCTVYTTDFGGGLRAYKLGTAELIYAVGTTVNGSSTGSIAMTDEMMVVIPIFTDDVSGSLLQFDAKTGTPMGLSEGSPVLAGPTSDLARPIGVLFMNTSDMSPPVDGDSPTDPPTTGPTSDPPTTGPTSEGTSYHMSTVFSSVGTAVVSLVLFMMW